MQHIFSHSCCWELCDIIQDVLLKSIFAKNTFETIPDTGEYFQQKVDPGGSGSTLLPPLHYFLSDYCTFFNVRKYLQFERNMKNMKYENRYAWRFVPILREALSDITNPFWLLRWEQDYGNLLSRDSHCEFMLQCVETVHLI